MELSAGLFFPIRRFCIHYTAHSLRNEWRRLPSWSYVGKWTHFTCATKCFLCSQVKKPTFITIYLELIERWIFFHDILQVKNNIKIFSIIVGKTSISSLRWNRGLEGWTHIKVNAWLSWGMSFFTGKIIRLSLTLQWFNGFTHVKCWKRAQQIKLFSSAALSSQVQR